ncbi:nicotinamide-nucleotide amidase [Natronocella acetinitrilica]|uniref:Nicotinamide-nucleotide amidase n=1 Tax=Natronocella acetinitrilica TaxID=414046 RepID=A0AAE3G434_9GAMM|nr:CinA family protein [Natronocella acetinitrilica]MCP1675435.1 nicotinamide-nucleotide amidase [Natronocella acetinitrilica]
MSDSPLYALAVRVGHCLKATGRTLATAESCTGGWISKLVTDRAGSSDWFDRGFVTYSNAAKVEMLGVPAELIQRHGAVSREVVEAMASGALERSQASVSVAVSGVAGPGGGSAGKPVGLVWFAWRVDDDVSSESLILPGDRDAVRRDAAWHALEGVLARLVDE